MCLSLLGRLAGGERERLLKQAEAAAPGDPAERREEMEVAMQQVRGMTPQGGGAGSGWVRRMHQARRWGVACLLMLIGGDLVAEE